MANPKDSALLAIVKITEPGCQRAELKIRTSDGQQGSLTVMVIPSGENKTCQVVEQAIKPLNLYERVDKVDEGVPLSSLKMSGRFTLTDAFVWTNAIFPDVPQLGEEDDKEHILSFKSAFLGTFIQMKLNEGSITILSNNLTSITIAKDTITQEAQMRKINVEI